MLRPQGNKTHQQLVEASFPGIINAQRPRGTRSQNSRLLGLVRHGGEIDELVGLLQYTHERPVSTITVFKTNPDSAFEREHGHTPAQELLAHLIESNPTTKIIHPRNYLGADEQTTMKSISRDTTSSPTTNTTSVLLKPASITNSHLKPSLKLEQ